MFGGPNLRGLFRLSLWESQTLEMFAIRKIQWNPITGNLSQTYPNDIIIIIYIGNQSNNWLVVDLPL